MRDRYCNRCAEDHEQRCSCAARSRRHAQTVSHRLPAIQRSRYARSMSAASLSVIVPSYNEESRLPALLDRLERDMDRLLADTSMRLVEVIVVDDGSSDATAAVVGAYDGLGGRLRLLRLDRNQ